MTDEPARKPVNYADPDFRKYIRHAFFKGTGLTDDDLQRPLIGICNTASELNHCNSHLDELAVAVKRGVMLAGGLPLEFPTISLSETALNITTMIFRNLMSMDAEEMITAQSLDGIVLLSVCDKRTPALLMGAASANIPAIMVTGDPMLNGH